ncbi:MAG: hypothetical protein ACE3L7_31630 [Candidatus Pristimantibacillus sp.]
MHQSRKEQGVERTARRLLHSERRESLIWAGLEENIEAADEWAGFPKSARREGTGHS